MTIMWWSKWISSTVLKEVEERSRAFFELVLPPVDIYEIGGTLVVDVDLPGFSKDNINIKVTKQSLTISAKREKTVEVDTAYVAQRPLRIKKVIRLPVEVDTETEPSAKYENGVLTVKLQIKGSKSVKIES
jgi:HSP20 family protein